MRAPFFLFILGTVGCSSGPGPQTRVQLAGDTYDVPGGLSVDLDGDAPVLTHEGLRLRMTRTPEGATGSLVLDDETIPLSGLTRLDTRTWVDAPRTVFSREEGHHETSLFMQSEVPVSEHFILRRPIGLTTNDLRTGKAIAEAFPDVDRPPVTVASFVAEVERLAGERPYVTKVEHEGDVVRVHVDGLEAPREFHVKSFVESPEGAPAAYVTQLRVHELVAPPRLDPRNLGIQLVYQSPPPTGSFPIVGDLHGRAFVGSLWKEGDAKPFPGPADIEPDVDTQRALVREHAWTPSTRVYLTPTDGDVLGAGWTGGPASSLIEVPGFADELVSMFEGQAPLAVIPEVEELLVAADTGPEIRKALKERALEGRKNAGRYPLSPQVYRWNADTRAWDEVL